MYVHGGEAVFICISEKKSSLGLAFGSLDRNITTRVNNNQMGAVVVRSHSPGLLLLKHNYLMM